MTLILLCLAVAAVSTGAALLLTTRRRPLPTPVVVLFGVNLLATVVAIVLTVLTAAGP